MTIIASGPSPAQRRTGRRLARSIPRPAAISATEMSGGALSARGMSAQEMPGRELPILSAHTGNLRAVSGVLVGVGSGVETESAPKRVIENVLPLSGCLLKVQDLADGSRLGQLFGPSGQWLDEARCGRTSQVSGWFGRTEGGATWALAFGAGGTQESLEVRFASLRARRVVQVVSDDYGLWVAEAVGNFRAATILASTRVTTFRLHYVA